MFLTMLSCHVRTFRYGTRSEFDDDIMDNDIQSVSFARQKRGQQKEQAESNDSEMIIILYTIVRV